jgi:hypothetical protein
MLFLLGSGLFGCGTESPPEPSAPELPADPPPAPLVAPRRIATAAAFDLVPLGDGAVLSWGVPVAEGGGVRVLELDSKGGVRGSEVEAATQGNAAGRGMELGPALVEEVAAAVHSDRVALVWAVRSNARVRAEATQSSARLSGFSPPAPLGDVATRSLDHVERGRLRAFDGPAGAFEVAWVAPVDPSGNAPIHMRTLVGDTARTLLVERPCARPLVGVLGHGDALFQAVCHGGESPITTLYAIDAGGPPLATASEVLSSCEPIGLTPSSRGVFAVASCQDGIAAIEMDPRGHTLASARGVTRAAECRDGRPTLEIGALSLSLREPRGDLEPMLPETIAPPGSRALWTGEALLVGSVSGRDLSIHRFECVRQELRPTQPF